MNTLVWILFMSSYKYGFHSIEFKTKEECQKFNEILRDTRTIEYSVKTICIGKSK